MAHLCIRSLHCENVVRQGGVLSLYLLVADLDELSAQMEVLKAECIVGNMVVIHLLLLIINAFAPSQSGLQYFLNVCYDCVAERQHIFNCNSS